MTVHRTSFGLDDFVTAPDMRYPRNDAQYTVEAIKIDKHGVQYYLREPKKQFPDVSGSAWFKEHDVKAIGRQL